MKETEVAKHIVDYLSGFDLYFEVPFGDVDIVMKQDNIFTAIEVKVRLNFKVVEQAYMNVRNYNYSYIAVPNGKDRSFAYQICEHYGIGVLEVYFHNGKFSSVTEKIKPKFNRKSLTKYIHLNDEMKKSIPGASGSDGTTRTAFKITLENIEEYVSRHSGCKIQEVFENINHHYYSISSAKNSIYKWIREGIIKSLYIDNGKLYLIK